MSDDGRLIFAVVVATILVLGMVGLMGLLMVVNTGRRQRYRADLAEAELQRTRAVQSAEREAVEQTLAEVGRELHDNVGQLLTVTQMGLRNVEAERPADLGVASTMEALELGIEEVRRLGRSLNQELWQERSIVEALRTEGKRIERAGSVQFTLHVDGELAEPNADTKIILFRTVQEVLNNALRHSGATHIEVTLRGDPLELRISDNGKGFDRNTAKNGGGLLNIVHRCDLIGYRATLEARPGAGCSWTLTPHERNKASDRIGG
jgi:signal transduction histidine kinase